MDRNKRTEDITGKKENMESKIPKSIKSSTAKEASSKIPSEKERAKNLKRTVKIDTVSSLKGRQMKTNLQKNVKPMSIAKMSKDIMDHFETESLNLEDLTSESASHITVQDKRNTTKRVPLKEKCSQTSQKQSGRLSKKPSASDLKPCTAFGGMRFTSKKNTKKVDLFHEMTKETKRDHQASNLAEPAVAKETAIITKELKTSDSEKAVMSKGIERSNEENLKNLPSSQAKSSKATSLIAKEAALKKCIAFGGIHFSPKWQSTPLKPDLFENLQKDSKHDKKMHFSDTPDSTKAIVREKVEAANITPGKTVQSPSKEAEYFKTASNTMNETSFNVCTAFAGMRLIPKRKSTLPIPDIFERERKESEIDDKELQPSDESVEVKKMSSYATKMIMTTETQHSSIEKSDQYSTEMAKSTETVSTTTKEVCRIAAFGGIGLAPRVRSTSIKSNIFESTQKESKTADLEPQLTNFSVKEMKKIPDTSKALIKAGTQHSNIEKLPASTTEKPESTKIHIEKNMNECLDKTCIPNFHEKMGVV
ncbi:hypothetical protein HNY73_022617 [Argiope bruennichi]|uniref:Uncharacterized protein n=1 Tax=Argiope bruennichi TaxID=94029 RepID=A0A8T0E5P5_ARGBR|nr:hypothetical protein HNY73_022617 [Argiope bruennichi]